LQVAADRVGADTLQTPREVIRDFISVLNILRQNPQASFAQLVHSNEFKPSLPAKDPDVDEAGKYSEFKV
jgi:hypothetical protein